MSPLNNLIIKIRTGLLAHKKSIFIRKTNLNLSIICAFYNLGLITSFFYSKKDNTIEVVLKYIENQSLIKNIQRISLPSRRVFCSVTDLKQNFFFKRLNFMFLSTSVGVLSKQEAIVRNVGGEPLFYVVV